MIIIIINVEIKYVKIIQKTNVLIRIKKIVFIMKEYVNLKKRYYVKISKMKKIVQFLIVSGMNKIAVNNKVVTK